MRRVSLLVLIASLASIAYGYWTMDQDPVLGHRCIGIGTVGIFLVAMPLFLYANSQGKKMEDYMLNKENIKKMQEEEDRKTKKSS